MAKEIPWGEEPVHYKLEVTCERNGTLHKRYYDHPKSSYGYDILTKHLTKKPGEDWITVFQKEKNDK